MGADPRAADVSALLPWLARSPQELTTSYAAMGLIESTCIFLGPLLAGIVFAFATERSISGSRGWRFLIFRRADASAARPPCGARTRRTRQPPMSPLEDFRAADLWAGFGYVLHDDRRRLLVALAGSGMLMLGVIDTIVIVLAIDILHTGDAGVGFLNAALGIGSMVGASIAMVAGQRTRLFPAMRAGLIVTGMPLAAIAAAPVAAAPMLAFSGAGMQLTDVCARTMLQRVVPDDKLGRVFGVLESLYVGLEGIGAFLASLLVVWVGPRWGLLLASSLLPVAGFLIRNRLASLDVGVRVPSEEMARLRTTDLFAPLPPQALERVARDLVPLDVPARRRCHQGRRTRQSLLCADGRKGHRLARRRNHRGVWPWRLLRRSRLVARSAPERDRDRRERAAVVRTRARRVHAGAHGPQRVDMKARSVAAERAVVDPSEDGVQE